MGADSVTIATDDERIRDAAVGFGATCLMTGMHESGTDRVAEVARHFQFADDDIVLNWQGDEPMVPQQLIVDLIALLRDTPAADIATPVAPVQGLAQFLDTNCVKAVRSKNGLAMYFSRAPIPWPRDQTTSSGGSPSSYERAFRHIGIYAYRVKGLLEFTTSPPTKLELVEKLEQLRALEMGMKIYLKVVDEAPPAGVDTLDDFNRVRDILSHVP